ncbi:uncharacterized protein LOC106672631 isoform X2 [Cimex lectularius]|uniref:C2H2-type domain-containing protein n=1 Tax=Cimex lectularius TaxID=79782 RepID=A0A8I6SI88_CIMLE|nr:uncharacterized protein LOC106672631 isoform X2 [Cimex lectularius]
MAINVDGVRKKAYTKLRVLAWTFDLERDCVVFCGTPKCPFMAFDIQEMALHFSTCFSFTESALSVMSVCTVCQKGASCQTKLNNHMIKAHPTEARELGIRDYTVPLPSEVIKIPKITRESWKVLLEHKGYIKCPYPYCLFLTEYISVMEKHYGNCHKFCNSAVPGQLFYTCTTCSGRTAVSQEMERHITYYHPVGASVNTPTNVISLDLAESWTKKLLTEKFINCLTKDCRYITDNVDDLKRHYRFCRVPQSHLYSVCSYCLGWLSPNKLKAHVSICTEKKRDKILTCSNPIGYLDKSSINNNPVVSSERVEKMLCKNRPEAEFSCENGFPKSSQNKTTSISTIRRSKRRKGSPMKESNDSNNQDSNQSEDNTNEISNKGEKNLVREAVVRRNGYSKMRVLAWTHFLNRDGFILCKTPKCLFMAVSIQEMMLHFSSCFESTSFQNRLSMCKICQRGTSNDDKLQNHMVSVHPVEAEKIGFKTYIIPEPSNCKPSKATKESWLVQLEYKGYIKCVEPFCNFLTEDVVKMEKHFGKCLQLFNKPKSFFTCNVCNGRMTEYKDLNDHINMCHPPGTNAHSPTNKISHSQIEEWHRILKSDGIINCPTKECQYQTSIVDNLKRHYRFCQVSNKDIYSTCQFCNGCLKSTSLQDHKFNCPEKECDQNQTDEKEKKMESSKTHKNQVQAIYYDDQASDESMYSICRFCNSHIQSTTLHDHQSTCSENECDESQTNEDEEQIGSSETIESANIEVPTSSRTRQRCAAIKQRVQNKPTQLAKDLSRVDDEEDMLITSFTRDGTPKCQKQYKSPRIKKQITPIWPAVVPETDESTKDIDLIDLEPKINTIKIDTRFESNGSHLNTDLQRLENKFFQPNLYLNDDTVDIGPDLSDILNIPPPAEMQQNKNRPHTTKWNTGRSKILIKRTYNYKSSKNPISEHDLSLDEEPEVGNNRPNKIYEDDPFETESMLQHLGNKIMQENISDLIPVKVSVNDESWTVNVPPLEVAKKVVQRERHSYKLRTIYKKSFNQSQALLRLTNSICTVRNMNDTAAENRIEGRERIQNVNNNVLLNKILSLKCQQQGEKALQPSTSQEEPSQAFNDSNKISELLRHYAAEIELEQKSFTDIFDIDHLIGDSSDNESLNQLIQNAECD